jgi:hypothetical protein
MRDTRDDRSRGSAAAAAAAGRVVHCQPSKERRHSDWPKTLTFRRLGPQATTTRDGSYFGPRSAAAELPPPEMFGLGVFGSGQRL